MTTASGQLVCVLVQYELIIITRGVIIYTSNNNKSGETHIKLYVVLTQCRLVFFPGSRTSREENNRHATGESKRKIVN